MKALYLAVSLFVVSGALAPAVAQATPIDDYVGRNGKAVCAALDKVDDGGDIFRLSLHHRQERRIQRPGRREHHCAISRRRLPMEFAEAEAILRLERPPDDRARQDGGLGCQSWRDQ